MKATAKYNLQGLKARSELAGAEYCAKALQLRFYLVATKGPLKPAHPYRLRAGDVILYENRICPVLRVSECCAVIEVARAAREFTTIFGNCVRIASNSTVRILKRRMKGGAL